MKDRIRELRKDHLKMSQRAFAEKLNLSENYIWMIEKGDRIPPDRTIADICREFGVDRVWLETGVGDPFRPRSREDEIATALAQAMNCNESAKNRIIRAMAQLPDELFPYVERILDELAANLQQDK
jgi:transcriptional regulator with XRE-family HTH domain